MNVSMLLAAGAGFLSFLSPCVLPLVPSYLAFVAGVSFGDLRARPGPAERRALVLNALGFIAGFSLVFVVMGAAATVLGGWIAGYRGVVQKVGGVLIILFGLYLIGILRVPFLTRQVRLPLARKPAGALGALAVGVTFGAGWTPCVGPVLGSILTLASTTERLADGTLLLAAYAAGLGLPFLASALAMDRFVVVFARFRPFLPIVDRVAGTLLVAVGLLLVMNYMPLLNAYFISLTPQWLIERL
jgi:cytochrome c-type biogenesis protein